MCLPFLQVREDDDATPTRGNVTIKKDCLLTVASASNAVWEIVCAAGERIRRRSYTYMPEPPSMG